MPYVPALDDKEENDRTLPVVPQAPIISALARARAFDGEGDDDSNDGMVLQSHPTHGLGRHTRAL